MFTVWIKVDETLPWIELKETYGTRKEAKRAVDLTIQNIKMKIVSTPETAKRLKAIAALRPRR